MHNCSLIWVIFLFQSIASIGISDPDLHVILTKLSKELKKKDRNKLLHCLPDGEKRKIEKTPNTLLQALWEKEKRKSNGRTNLGK